MKIHEANAKSAGFRSFLAPIAVAGFLATAVFAAAPPQPQSQSPSPAPQEQSKPKHNDKPSDSNATTHLQVIVTSKKSGKPIDNASVYIRFPEKPGSSKLSELDMKTDEDGRVKIPSIPKGRIMVQVVAPHWRTFGQWFDVEQPEMDIPVQLEEPSHWY